MKAEVIAIDGPAGAGKSTVAQRVAAKLNYTYIDTGAMYRAVTWKAIKKNTASVLTDDFIKNVVKDIDVRLQYKNGITNVFADGENITNELRSPEVSRAVSQTASLDTVREKMVLLQRQMAQHGAVVMDGRDIGSNVLPQADLKIFLTASVEERARRRFSQMHEKGYDIKFEELKADIASRDKVDTERAISPLVQAADAILLDSTAMTIDEVVEKILSLAKK